MNGLVYTLDDDADSTPVYWMGVMLAAFVIHAIPFFFLTFKMSPPPSMEESVTVSIDDSFLNMLANPTEPSATPAAKPDVPAPKEVAAVQPAANPVPPVPPDAPASIVETLPAVPEKPKAAAPKPPPTAPKPPDKTDTATTEKKPLHDKELPPLVPKSQTAFDESIDVSKTAPKDAYLSDRNSVAKDRGPKNLPIGDPYLDKGDTNLIKYLQKRGEGNLPPLESEANSGSVKVEGAAASGDGGGKQAKDFSKNVKTAEVTTPRPLESRVEAPPEKIAPIDKKSEVASLPSAPAPLPVKPDIRPILKPKTQEPDPIASETGTLPPPKKIKEVAAEPVQLPTEFALDTPKRIKPAEPIQRTATNVAKQPVSDPTVLQPTPIDKAIDQQAELDRFEAQLNGRNTSAANDGSIAGSGAKLRKGQQGHEGNGTTRPGDDNAVSDVTSINLESSATEFGDAQFAKKFDPKTAYIKRFARRIDGKWKADIVAHLRRSLIPGSVSIRIVIRKDGKLMEASEVYRDRGVRDDYVATAKRAVEEAATPNADPFPPALAERDTIEYTFTFLYN